MRITNSKLSRFLVLSKQILAVPHLPKNSRRFRFGARILDYFMLTMLLPIGDDNSDRHITPYVTYVLIALNIAIFMLLQLPNQAFTYGYSVVPAEILSGRDIVSSIATRGGIIPQAPGPAPIYLTVLSAMFMHGGWAHLGGNMLFLWIFGDNVEDAMGHFKFAIFYLLCGILASVAHIASAQMAGGANLVMPSLGASGAVAGVLGGYLVLYPRKSVRVLVGWFRHIRLARVFSHRRLDGDATVFGRRRNRQGDGANARWRRRGLLGAHRRCGRRTVAGLPVS